MIKTVVACVFVVWAGAFIAFAKGWINEDVFGAAIGLPFMVLIVAGLFWLCRNRGRTGHQSRVGIPPGGHRPHHDH